MTTTATTAAPATASYLSVDDAEKYCYGERSLPYLASALAANIGAKTRE